MTALPVPGQGPEAALYWVQAHLADVAGDVAAPSPRFRGGQAAADAALKSFEVEGYARARNEVWPPTRRGASGLSPYIRHGLLPLPRVWRSVSGGPPRDRDKFRDELLWQEYSRHLYSRLGSRLRSPLRAVPTRRPDAPDAWLRDMECLRINVDELETDGWLVNQTRMWLASQWTVRAGADWRRGEEIFFRHLLDGSRAANLLGWQWTVGAATGRPYGFSRWQVEKRAPGLCRRCVLERRCPIQDRVAEREMAAVGVDERMRGDSDPDRTAGPRQVESLRRPDVVWLTAESLGLSDPALSAHPELPVVFVFDRRLLKRWRLSAKRLIFLTETLAEIGRNRELEIHHGDPREVLGSRHAAVVFTPVEGWRRIAAAVSLAEIHPWPWLARPRGGSLSSFSVWRKQLGMVVERGARELESEPRR